MENKSCYEKCQDRQTIFGKENECFKKMYCTKYNAPIPTPTEMIEVEGFNQVLDYDTENGHESRKNNVKIMIDPTQPAIQTYLAQEIERRKLIPRKDAVKYVGIDADKISGILNRLVKIYSKSITNTTPDFNIQSPQIIGLDIAIAEIKKLNPLKLKQQGEGKNE